MFMLLKSIWTKDLFLNVHPSICTWMHSLLWEILSILRNSYLNPISPCKQYKSGTICVKREFNAWDYGIGEEGILRNLEWYVIWAKAWVSTLITGVKKERDNQAESLASTKAQDMKQALIWTYQELLPANIMRLEHFNIVSIIHYFNLLSLFFV